ncbi:glycosyltransferase [Sphaerochaeta sp.]|uniref:glycosyltransferase n=1 Tax=Sphaerochaeta sp. TaxID=1972642 RepID=UPI002FC6DADE
MTDVISVIVPVYNAQTTLERCLSSIINQSYTELEIFLINDGSIDESLFICQKFAQQDSRIHVIDQQNGGVSKARNSGILKATGKYIGFIDADDWIEPTHFEQLHRGMTCIDNCCLAVVGVVSAQWESYLQTLCAGMPYHILSFEQTVDEITKEYGIRGYLWNKLFLRNDMNLDTTLSVCEDLEFVIRYIANLQRETVVMNACLYHYEIPTSHAFSDVRYDFPRLATRFLAYDLILDLIPTSLEFASRRIRKYQCKFAYQMLVAWYALSPEERAQEDSKMIDGVKHYFYNNLSDGMHSVSLKQRIKYLLFLVSPSFLVKLLKMKKDLSLTFPDQEEG